jgi:hypothetical protein
MKDMTRDEALESARKWIEHHGTETRAYGPSERHMETAARIIEALIRPASDNVDLRAEIERLRALLKRLVGPEKCPACNGWGEVTFAGQPVQCRCRGDYTYRPTVEDLMQARETLVSGNFQFTEALDERDRLAAENERLRAELTWTQVQASESGLKPGYELGQILAEIDDRARAALVRRY